MPQDAHPMGVLVNALSALSVFHPDANPALRVSNTNCVQDQATNLLSCSVLMQLYNDNILWNFVFRTFVMQI
jgi:hypothetical protein